MKKFCKHASDGKQILLKCTITKKRKKTNEEGTQLNKTKILCKKLNFKKMNKS